VTPNFSQTSARSGVHQAKRMKDLEKKAQLKRLLADAELDKAIL
jgi:hypothetical protein